MISRSPSQRRSQSLVPLVVVAIGLVVAVASQAAHASHGGWHDSGKTDPTPYPPDPGGDDAEASVEYAGDLMAEARFDAYSELLTIDDRLKDGHHAWAWLEYCARPAGPVGCLDWDFHTAIKAPHYPYGDLADLSIAEGTRVRLSICMSKYHQPNVFARCGRDYNARA